MDKGKPAFFGNLIGPRLGIVEPLAMQYDIGLMAFSLLYFYRRRVFGHNDRDRYAEPMAMIGNALRMVAGRSRDHAALAFTVRQLEQLVQRTPFLKRSGELQIFKFQPDIRARQIRERLALHGRGPNDRIGNALMRSAYALQRDGRIGIGICCCRHNLLALAYLASRANTSYASRSIPMTGVRSWQRLHFSGSA